MSETMTEAEREQRWTDWLDDDEGGTINVAGPIESTHIVRATLDVLIPLRLPPWVDPDAVLSDVLEAIGEISGYDLTDENRGYWSEPEFICAEDHDGDDGVLGVLGTIEEAD